MYIKNFSFGYSKFTTIYSVTKFVQILVESRGEIWDEITSSAQDYKPPVESSLTSHRFDVTSSLTNNFYVCLRARVTRHLVVGSKISK